MEQFFADMAELLEVGEFDANRALQEYDNWDSLTVLSLTAMLDQKFGVSMTAKELGLYPTGAELFAHIQQRAR